MSKAAPQNKHQEFLQNSDQLLVQLLRAARAGDKNDAVVIDQLCCLKRGFFYSGISDYQDFAHKSSEGNHLLFTIIDKFFIKCL